MHPQTETEVLNFFFFLDIFSNLFVVFLETWRTICFLLTKQQLKETGKRKRLTLNSHLEQSSTSAAQKYYESVHPSSLYRLWPLSELLLFSQAAVLSAPRLPQCSKDSIRAVFLFFFSFATVRYTAVQQNNMVDGPEKNQSPSWQAYSCFVTLFSLSPLS